MRHGARRSRALSGAARRARADRRTGNASSPTTPLSLALRFSAFTMREIGLVLAPLDPRPKSEALFNRIGMQEQHALEEPAQLRPRECRRFFLPDALASAREKNGPAS